MTPGPARSAPHRGGPVRLPLREASGLAACLAAGLATGLPAPARRTCSAL